MMNVDCTFHPKLSSIAGLGAGGSGAVDDFHYSSGAAARGGNGPAEEHGRSKSAPRLRPGASSSPTSAFFFSSYSHSPAKGVGAASARGDARGAPRRDGESYLVPGLRQHYARMRHAKELAIERERKLNRCDGTGWTPTPTLSSKAPEQRPVGSPDDDRAPISKLRQSTFGYETNTHMEVRGAGKDRRRRRDRSQAGRTDFDTRTRPQGYYGSSNL